ncbi:zinc ribbon domain-containing protein [Candidatus Uhrbacteria bacterium]|nr:zinc ribbon domain-containing protein [Candidatus Uhrbacteria bacterium]
MPQDKPSFELGGLQGESELSDAGKDALQKLNETLVAQGIPSQERQEYVSRFIQEVSGETNETVIKTILGRLLLESIKRARALKSAATSRSEGKHEAKVNFCSGCGAPVSSSTANFCVMCGNKLK